MRTCLVLLVLGSSVLWVDVFRPPSIPVRICVDRPRPDDWWPCRRGEGRTGQPAYGSPEWSHASGISLPYVSRVMLSGSGPPRTSVSMQRGVVAVVADPDLRLEEHLVAGDARAADAFADLSLVGVGGGRVDMTVAEVEGLLDRGGRDIGRGLEDAEPYGRHLHTVIEGDRGNGRHRESSLLLVLLHGSSPSYEEDDCS